MRLLKKFPLIPITDEDVLDDALEILDKLTAKGKLDEGEEKYLAVLTLLVEQYEDSRHAIGPASDQDMLRHLMETRGINQAMLHRETKIAKSTISEVLAGRRRFSKTMIRKLADYFRVDISVLAANI